MSPLDARIKVLAMSISLEIVMQKEQANLKEDRLKKASGDRQKLRGAAGSQRLAKTPRLICEVSMSRLRGWTMRQKDKAS